ncbi:MULTISPECIES: DUF2878 domain-containing protein [unclassified Wenzhouxiangella]|uniref:DUF2878 domain-containing protein n=1 Tax=unclassified Wenzhouxiangella TaxID=2613841 RepID=UPI000E32A45B|nr:MULTISPECIES: DUF2878 domain-containing protein [unclassified Wenzhouxiangella]RFF28778.1 DUF2878 domain-containing protein [Wenzhouxiangella sp. 15181]RFP67818.1 DUF2878 domain-containing protein [Wenzhouxiangella sp. 15190]
MKRDFWINQGLFQLSWPACVVGASWGIAGWSGPLVVAALVFWQLHPRRRHPNDWGMIALCLGIGFALDTLWVQWGLLAYAMPWPSSGFAPFWILLLWLALALVLNHSMSVFKHRLLLIGLLGAVGSPMSYYAGSRFGAVEWLAPAWQVVLATGLSWALLLPALFWLARRPGGRLDRSETTNTPSRSVTP